MPSTCRVSPRSRNYPPWSTRTLRRMSKRQLARPRPRRVIQAGTKRKCRQRQSSPPSPWRWRRSPASTRTPSTAPRLSRCTCQAGSRRTPAGCCYTRQRIVRGTSATLAAVPPAWHWRCNSRGKKRSSCSRSQMMANFGLAAGQLKGKGRYLRRSDRSSTACPEQSFVRTYRRGPENRRSPPRKAHRCRRPRKTCTPPTLRRATKSCPRCRVREARSRPHSPCRRNKECSCPSCRCTSRLPAPPRRWKSSLPRRCTASTRRCRAS